MPAELSQTDHHVRHHVSRWWLLRDVALVLGVFAVAGVVAGVAWELWWEAPTGVVVDGAWFPDDAGLRQVFSGTALYITVALGGGVLAGAVSAWFVDRVEVLTLVLVVVGSVLAGWVMLQVGAALGPPDPAVLARSAADGTALRGSLEVSGDSALVGFPAGALLGLVVVFIGLTPTRASRG